MCDPISKVINGVTYSLGQQVHYKGKPCPIIGFYADDGLVIRCSFKGHDGKSAISTYHGPAIENGWYVFADGLTVLDPPVWVLGAWYSDSNIGTYQCIELVPGEPEKAYITQWPNKGAFSPVYLTDSVMIHAPTPIGERPVALDTEKVDPSIWTVGVIFREGGQVYHYLSSKVYPIGSRVRVNARGVDQVGQVVVCDRRKDAKATKYLTVQEPIVDAKVSDKHVYPAERLPMFIATARRIVECKSCRGIACSDCPCGRTSRGDYSCSSRHGSNDINVIPSEWFQRFLDEYDPPRHIHTEVLNVCVGKKVKKHYEFRGIQQPTPWTKHRNRVYKFSNQRQ